MTPEEFVQERERMATEVLPILPIATIDLFLLVLLKAGDITLKVMEDMPEDFKKAVWEQHMKHFLRAIEVVEKIEKWFKPESK